VLLVFDHYTYNEVNRELRRGAEPVRVDPQQLDLLAMFLQNPGTLLSRQQIIESVWEGRQISDSVLSVSIAKLRKVLGKPLDGGDYIESRYGRGYRFLGEVKRTAAPAAQPLVASPVQPRAQIVGRNDELEQLHSAAERAWAGRGRLVLLTGEAGIGKTRLAECLDEHVQDDGRALTLWARCQPDVSTPLWPVRQVMRELVAQGLADASLLAFTDAQATAIDHGTLDALAQAVLHVSQRRPLLLILDDIQWADSASLRVMAYLADAIVRASCLLVCTLRYGGALATAVREVSPLWNHRNCQRIELQRLRAHEVTEYVEARLGAEHTAALSRALFARSEGNPFFMVDLLRSARDGELLHPSKLALSAVRERLQELPGHTLRVLYGAAVIGHDFDIGLLSHVTKDRPEEILDLLSGSIVSHSVRAIRGTVGAFSFDHELIREALYEEIAPQERARLHLHAAQGLQQRRANGGAVTDAELAHHFLSAQPLGDIEQAIGYAQSAAAEASRLAAHADGRALLRRALDVLSFRVTQRAETRAALLLQLAMVERVLGDPAYRANLAAAVSIAREHRLGRLLTFAGQLLSLSPDVVAHAEAVEVLEAANETLEPDDYENLAIVRAHLAWTAPNSHSKRRVDELTRQAQELAHKSGSANARAAVDDTLLFFRAGPDTFEKAEQIAHEIERASAQEPELTSHARRVLVARFWLITAMQRGDRAGLARGIEMRAALMSRMHNAEAKWHHDRMLVVKAMNEGAFREIKPELSALRERARRLELHASQLLWSLDYGVFLCRTSDVSSLAPRVCKTLEPSKLDSPQVRAGKIRSLVDFGLQDKAAEAMSQLSLAEIADLPWDRDCLAVLCHLAVGAAAARNLEQCEMLARLLSPYSEFYAVGVSFHCDGSVASHLGLLSETLGQWDRARAYYAHGREREQAFGLMPCAALTGMRLARLLLREEAVSSAGLQLLEHVRAEALRMGMQPLARAAYDLRRRAGRAETTSLCADTLFAQPAAGQREQSLDDC
jgi:DNA-binding winged helix-turn-helix (wHTH) protein